MPEIPTTGNITFVPKGLHYAEELRQAVLLDKPMVTYKGSIIIISNPNGPPRILHPGSDCFEDLILKREDKPFKEGLKYA